MITKSYVDGKIVRLAGYFSDERYNTEVVLFFNVTRTVENYY